LDTRLEVFDRVFNRAGRAKQNIWLCQPTRGRPWQVGYTTGRIVGGPFDGKFAALAYKPVGTDQWERVYYRAFSKRTAAKARAIKLYCDHSKPSVRARYLPG
jgi:hypothetical protein